MYDVPETVTLSGATRAQLAYWRKPTAGSDAIMPASRQSGRRIYYSFEDVVALRTFAHLRETVSLPKIRAAVANLRTAYPDTHLSAHKLFTADRKTVVQLTPDGDFVDLVAKPGQRYIDVIMREIYGPFELADGTVVPDLERPTSGITIDPEVRSGTPCLDGTRIPYSLVAGLARDGLDARKIVELYPSATATSIEGATEFAGWVALAA